jgi:hypothetical protein
MLHIKTSVQNQSVDVYFEFTGRGEDCGINWDTIIVEALLPQRFEEQPVTVVVNDLLSDEDNAKIKAAIYANWQKLEDQYLETEDGEP